MPYKFNNTFKSVVAFVPQQNLVIAQDLCHDGHYVHEDVPSIIQMAISTVGTLTQPLSLQTAFSLLCLHSALCDTKVVLGEKLPKQVFIKTSF